MERSESSAPRATCFEFSSHLITQIERCKDGKLARFYLYPVTGCGKAETFALQLGNSGRPGELTARGSWNT